MGTQEKPKALHVTVEEIGALQKIVESSYTNACEDDDDNDREMRDLLTSLLEKLEQAFLA